MLSFVVSLISVIIWASDVNWSLLVSFLSCFSAYLTAIGSTSTRCTLPYLLNLAEVTTPHPPPPTPCKRQDTQVSSARGVIHLLRPSHPLGLDHMHPLFRRHLCFLFVIILLSILPFIQWLIIIWKLLLGANREGRIPAGGFSLISQKW